jgi:hypothetical protein
MPALDPAALVSLAPWLETDHNMTAPPLVCWWATRAAASAIPMKLPECQSLL